MYISMSVAEIATIWDALTCRRLDVYLKIGSEWGELGNLGDGKDLIRSGSLSAGILSSVIALVVSSSITLP